MSADVGGQTSQWAWSVETRAPELTAAVVQSIIQGLLNHHQRKREGEQSLRQLNRQGRKLDSVELESPDLRRLRRELNRYGVDFSLQKEKQTGKAYVYFKAQDAILFYAGLKQYTEKARDKKPAKEIIQAAMEKVANRAAETVDRARTAQKNQEQAR